jgi:hypothetical protein
MAEGLPRDDDNEQQREYRAVDAAGRVHVFNLPDNYSADDLDVVERKAPAAGVPVEDLEDMDRRVIALLANNPQYIEEKIANLTEIIRVQQSIICQLIARSKLADASARHVKVLSGVNVVRDYHNKVLAEPDTPEDPEEGEPANKDDDLDDKLESLRNLK